MAERTRRSATTKIASSLRSIAAKGAALSRLVPVDALSASLVVAFSASAQTPGVAERPYQGWSSFSQQTSSNNFLTQANMRAQSDALLASGLQTHGFNYIYMDSGWEGSFDANGRPIPNTSTFPDIAALISHIHSNGQKAGIYWIPGVEYPAVVANSPILGTPYHIQDILAVPYRAGNAFGGPGGPPPITTRSTSPSPARRNISTLSWTCSLRGELTRSNSTV